eukprot:CAMPEP_0194401064 /NCGR_PEP_ID=MMETSP0174-20130528/127593_1 /TAXON_ID=216777 /ORGANISM="Proboscia alata, Strain PI-D3" /LENGTH=108 /DNA_ID=CAMNT_0039197713 /DNA_START=1793 /DNA_END=2116 /DNA_ORIENTATION=+
MNNSIQTVATGVVVCEFHAKYVSFLGCGKAWIPHGSFAVIDPPGRRIHQCSLQNKVAKRMSYVSNNGLGMTSDPVFSIRDFVEHPMVDDRRPARRMGGTPPTLGPVPT